MIATRAAIACVVLAIVTPGHAEPAKDRAGVLFREGRALMAEGKFAEAIAAFEQSQRLRPAIATLINLAGCHEELGQLATAWGLYVDAESQTRSASDPLLQQLHQNALKHAARIEPHVPRLTIRVLVTRRLGRLEILRDAETIGSALWNRPRRLDGGVYTITARAPSAVDWVTRVTLTSQDDHQTVDIPDLDPPPLPSLPPLPPPPPPQPVPARAATSRRIPIAIGATGVALLGGAVGFALWGNASYGDAKAETADQQRRDSLASSANHQRYFAEGLGAAGVGCAGLAIWLYLRDAETAATPAEHVMIAPTASGISVVGQF